LTIPFAKEHGQRATVASSSSSKHQSRDPIEDKKLTLALPPPQICRYKAAKAAKAKLNETTAAPFLPLPVAVALATIETTEDSESVDLRVLVATQHLRSASYPNESTHEAEIDELMRKVVNMGAGE
jgi:hypothetical protein